MTDYTDEEYEAWVMELIEFFRRWPYPGPKKWAELTRLGIVIWVIGLTLA